MHPHADAIIHSVRLILESIPPSITVVAAAKTRTTAEVEAAIQAGITHVGHNYVQECQKMSAEISPALRAATTWHLIGHLQRNKAQPAVRLFDVIETVASFALAQEMDRRSAALGKTTPILIEVNSAREENKSGVFPEAVPELFTSLASLEHVQVQGLMTMGPLCENPQDLRPYFRQTRLLFEQLNAIPNVPQKLRFLSMGMSDSYLIAIEEGANIVRIGTRIFGERPAR